jgi:hypothetical protein
MDGLSNTLGTTPATRVVVLTSFQSWYKLISSSNIITSTTQIPWALTKQWRLYILRP